MIVLARAVQHAHERGILHRDLKPSNVLLDEHGCPHVTDFGLARWLVEATELTPSGAVLGSPPYMAPEQATGSRHATTILSDVYGLGAILYAMLTGQAPFRGDSAAQVLHRLIHETPETPRRSNPRIGRGLECIGLTCLEKALGRRYRSAEALADDLERWLQGRPIKARPVGRLVRLGLWCRRHPVQAGLPGCLVISVVLGISGVLRQMGRADHEMLIARHVNDFFLETILDPLEPGRPMVDRSRTLGEIFDRAEQQIETRLHPSPHIEATERWLIGGVRLRIGEYAKAEHHLRIAHNLFLALRGLGHFGVIKTREALALTLARWQMAIGRRAEAEANIRKVLGRIEGLGPPGKSLDRRARALLASGARSSGCHDATDRHARSPDHAEAQ